MLIQRSAEAPSSLNDSPDQHSRHLQSVRINGVKMQNLVITPPDNEGIIEKYDFFLLPNLKEKAKVLPQDRDELSTDLVGRFHNDVNHGITFHI